MDIAKVTHILMTLLFFTAFFDLTIYKDKFAIFCLVVLAVSSTITEYLESEDTKYD